MNATDPRAAKWRLAPLLLLAGLAPLWPALTAPAYSDDLYHRDMIGGAIVARPAYDLFRFSRAEEIPLFQESGVFPWWTSQDLAGSMLRPLGSVLVRFNHTLFGSWAWHVQQGLWLLLASWFALRLMRSHVGRAGAVAAAMAFMLSPGVVVPVGWVASLPALAAVCIGIESLRLYDLQARGGTPWWRPVLTFSSCVLLGGEYGVCIAAYAVAYELVFAEDAWRARARRLATFSLPAVSYLAIWRLGHYGMRGVGTYMDPTSNPIAFLGVLPERLGRLCANVWFRINTFSWLQVGHRNLVLCIVGVLVLLMMAPWLRASKRARVVAWLTLGSVLALIPTCSAFPHPRVLLVASLGPMAWVGALVDEWSTLRPGKSLTRLLALCGAVVSIGLHLGFAPYDIWKESAGLAQRARADVAQRRAAHELVSVADARERPVFFLGGARQPIPYGPPAGFDRPSGERWIVLASAFDADIMQISQGILEISARKGAVAGGDFFRRANDPLKTGARFHQRDFDAEVLEVSAGAATRIRITLRSRANPIFVAGTGAALMRIDLPEVGVPLCLPIGTKCTPSAPSRLR